MQDGHEGTLSSGGLRGIVRFEPGDHISVTARAPLLSDHAAALRQTHDLPGNLRFAHGQDGTVLLADTLRDGSLHLEGTFRQILRGFEELGRCAHGAGGAQAPALDAPAVPPRFEGQDAAELRGLLLRRDDGVFELRPALGQEVVPVELRLDAAGARLERCVLRAPEECLDVIALQALRLNAELCEARLALRDSEVLAETRLHPGQLRASWLLRAAQAVAAAFGHARATLCFLAEDNGISALFRDLFLKDERPLGKD